MHETLTVNAFNFHIVGCLYENRMRNEVKFHREKK